MDSIVLYIETDESNATKFLYSLDKLNIPSKNVYFNDIPFSLFNKLPIYVNGLKSIDNEWVILSDARDVLFYKDINTINDSYKNNYAQFDFVVQAEDTVEGCNIFQQTELTRFVLGKTKYCYPCSGLIMGKRLAIIDFFKSVIDDSPDDWKVADQPAIEWGMYNLKPNGTIDEKCHLFQTMGMGTYSGVNFDLHFNKSYIKNIYTQTEPCIFHGAGRAFLEPVERIIRGLYGNVNNKFF
jgi:hypothetical protein